MTTNYNLIVAISALVLVVLLAVVLHRKKKSHSVVPVDPHGHPVNPVGPVHPVAPTGPVSPSHPAHPSHLVAEANPFSEVLSAAQGTPSDETPLFVNVPAGPEHIGLTLR